MSNIKKIILCLLKIKKYSSAATKTCGVESVTYCDIVLFFDAHVELFLQLLLPPLELLEEQQLLVECQLIEVCQFQLWIQLQLLSVQQ